jgi:ATP-binding cassette, subfamily B, bacterial PglK
MKLNKLLLSNIFSLLDKELKFKVFVLTLLNIISIFFDVVGIGMVIPLAIILIEEKSVLIEKFSFLESIVVNFEKSELLVIAISIFLVFYLIKSIFATFLTLYDKKFVHFSQVNYGEKLLLKYLSENYIKFLKYNSSVLIRNIIYESGIFVSSVIHNLINLFVEIILIIGISILLIYYEPIGSIISMIIIFVISSCYILFFKKKLISLGKKRQLIDGTLIKSLNQVFTLFREVRLFDKSNYLIKKFKDYSLERARISVFEQLVSSLPRIYFEFLALFILTIIVYIFVFFKEDVSGIVPILSLYAAAMFRVIPSANKIIGSINSLNHNLPAFEVVYEDLIHANKLYKRENNNHKFENFIKKELKINNITIKNLNFSFNKEDKNLNILKDINLEIYSGHITGLIGRTGSGKSTFANIISGLIDTYEGQIIINNNEKFNRNTLKKITGHVSQHVNLIDDTIINNICFGIDEDQINFEKVNEIIDELNLEELINSLPKKFNSNIGEQGLQLSGGQRQKISLARTLYLSPKIIIFDESTSSLDRKTEDEFMSVVNKIKKDKIILFITHNKLLEENFDVIYRIENNKILKIKN